jgi:hypothetical protein
VTWWEDDRSSFWSIVEFIQMPCFLLDRLCEVFGSGMVKPRTWKSRESNSIILHGAAVLPPGDLGVPTTDEISSSQTFLLPNNDSLPNALSGQTPFLVSFSQIKLLSMTCDPCHTRGLHGVVPGSSTMADRNITQHEPLDLFARP